MEEEKHDDGLDRKASSKKMKGVLVSLIAVLLIALAGYVILISVRKFDPDNLVEREEDVIRLGVSPPSPTETPGPTPTPLPTVLPANPPPTRS